MCKIIYDDDDEDDAVSTSLLKSETEVISSGVNMTFTKLLCLVLYLISTAGQ